MPPPPTTPQPKTAAAGAIAATPTAKRGEEEEDRRRAGGGDEAERAAGQAERSSSSQAVAPVSPQGGKYHMSPYPPLDAETVADRKTPMEIDAIIAKMKGEFMECAKAARDELMRLRSIAVERYAQLLLAEAAQFGAIQGTLGRLNLEKGSIAGLSRTVAEVDAILRDKVRGLLHNHASDVS